MRRILILVFLLSSFNTAFAIDYIDVVILKDSSRIEGIIIENVPNKMIIIKDFDSRNHKIPYSKILKFRKIPNYRSNLLFKEYSEFGVSLGTPGGLNINFGRWITRFGIGLSGMYFGNIYGFQANIKYRFSDNIDRSHSLSIFALKTHMEMEYNDYYYSEPDVNIMDWEGVGLTYILNYNGFWLEVGMGYGTMEVKERYDDWNRAMPQVVFQIGYVHRFID